MNKEGFKILIEAIDNIVLSVAKAGELKGVAWERGGLNSKDNIEKEAYMNLEHNCVDEINSHRQHIINMLTNFMNNTKDEENEQND